MESAYDAFQEGNRLLASQNPHAAVIALERARDLEPDKGSVRETLARAYFRTGRFAEARAEFERAVELEPVNDYAHFGLGLCLPAPGRPDRRAPPPQARGGDAPRSARLPRRARGVADDVADLTSAPMARVSGDARRSSAAISTV